MISVGADIRIVNIPRDSIAQFTRSFCKDNNLIISRDENVKENISNLQALNPINSYLKFWWYGLPQKIDWKFTEHNSENTKIETRFGYHKKYWFWIFSILSLIAFSFYFISKEYIFSGKFISATISSTVSYPFIVGILVASYLFFSMKSIISKNYRFVEDYESNLKKLNPNYFRQCIRTNPGNPHLFIFFFFTLSLMLIFLIYFGIPNNVKQNTTLLLVALFPILFIFILTVILLFSLKNKHYRQRLYFTLCGIGLVIPLIIFYSIPFIVPYFGKFSTIYYMYMKIQSAYDPSNTNLTYALKTFTHALNTYLEFKCLITFLILLVAIIGVWNINNLAASIKKWRHDLFTDNDWFIHHRKTIDFSKYSKSFSYTTFVLWLSISVIVFIQVFTIFRITEFCILGKNIIFTNGFDKNFCLDVTNIITFLTDPYLPGRWPKAISRIFLFIYGFPLLYMIYRVIRKRVGAYLRQLNDLKNTSFKANYKYLMFDTLCMKISCYFDIPKPKIAIIPSKFPLVYSSYLGFPYFESYIILSKGCFAMSENELSGILAHEVFHLKKHSFKWYLLNLLSDLSLFGTGFLAATTNSYLKELEADYNAALWVKKNGSIQDFIRALRLVSSTSSGKYKPNLGVVSNQSGPIKSELRKNMFLKRQMEKISQLFELYFGDEILSYIHPPLEERIERIRAIAEERVP